MKSEQKFMMIFRFTPNLNYQPTAQEITQINEDWGSFIGNIAIKEKLESTHQLGYDGKQIISDSSVKEGPYISENTIISGNMIVNAKSLDEAIEMAKDSPILKIGGTVEVRNIIPMQ